MEGRSLWRIANTQYLTGLPAISDILSSFARHMIFFLTSSTNNQISSSSVVASPQSLFNGDTHTSDIEVSNGSLVDSDFGDVPSSNEVEHAVATLQSFMQRLSPSNLSYNGRRRVRSPVLQRVDDAYRLLQTMPSVLIMVISITSDRVVWDAVMKNNDVQDFQRSLKQAILLRPPGSIGTDKDSNLVSMIIWWMINNSTLTVIGLIEKLKSLVSNIFQPSQEENTYYRESRPALEELITSTVLLSSLTLMIVIAIRTYGV